MSDERENRKKGRGFAGLSSLVSDVSGETARPAASVQSDSPGKPPSPPPELSRPDSAATIPDPNAGSGSPGKKGWIIGAVVVGLIWIVAASNGKKEEARPSFSYETPPYPAPAPAEVLGKTTLRAGQVEDGYRFIGGDPGDEKNWEPGTSLKAPTTDAATPPPWTSLSNQQKPPVGTGLPLNASQIRYCLTEKIRVKAVEGVLSDTSEREVDKFNARVSDYNSRCGEFRYRRGEVERVNRELDPDRERIALAAKSAWIRESLGLSNSPAASDNKTVRSRRPPRRRSGRFPRLRPPHSIRRSTGSLAGAAAPSSRVPHRVRARPCRRTPSRTARGTTGNVTEATGSPATSAFRFGYRRTGSSTTPARVALPAGVPKGLAMNASLCERTGLAANKDGCRGLAKASGSNCLDGSWGK